MYIIPNEISSETKVYRNIYITDLIIIVASFIITILFSRVINQKVVMYHYILSFGVTFLAISRSNTNPNVRNYKAMYLMLIRSRNSFHSLDWNDERSDYNV